MKHSSCARWWSASELVRRQECGRPKTRPPAATSPARRNPCPRHSSPSRPRRSRRSGRRSICAWPRCDKEPEHVTARDRRDERFFGIDRGRIGQRHRDDVRAKTIPGPRRRRRSGSRAAGCSGSTESPDRRASQRMSAWYVAIVASSSSGSRPSSPCAAPSRTGRGRGRRTRGAPRVRPSPRRAPSLRRGSAGRSASMRRDVVPPERVRHLARAETIDAQRLQHVAAGAQRRLEGLALHDRHAPRAQLDVVRDVPRPRDDRQDRESARARGR